MTDGPGQDERDELSAAARTLHREWDTPHLWPAIAASLEGEAASGRAEGRWHTRWERLAAAAVLVAALGSLIWFGQRLWIGDAPPPDAALLSEAALDEIERAEASYAGAIESLARAAAPAVERAGSPLLANLRERLVVIDAAIAECRAEIDRNRFNAHLRRHLLTIYQEKRRTLEQILELEQNAS